MDKTAEQVKIDIINIYTVHLGATTSSMYQNFYKKQDMNTVLTSAKELLSEFLGPQKGQDIISSIVGKYHLKVNNL